MGSLGCRLCGGYLYIVLLPLLGKGLKMKLTLMAHQKSGAPLLYTNGAPGGDTPLVWKTLMAHQAKGAPLVTKCFFFFQTN